MALKTLCIFMAIDYVSGLIVAGVFKASTKSESGALESRAGLKGLLRKMAMLCAVLMAYYLDQVAGTNFVRDAACMAFICNEALSIIENFGLMGVPIPDAITNEIDVHVLLLQDHYPQIPLKNIYRNTDQVFHFLP